MKRVLLISFLVLVTLIGHSQNLDGVWTLEKIEVTLTKNGQNDKKIYTKKEVFKTPVVCVEKLEFALGNNLSVLFRGWDKAETAPYVISEDTLTWSHPAASYKFHIRYDNGILEVSSEGEYSMDGEINQYRYVHYLAKRQKK